MEKDSISRLGAMPGFMSLGTALVLAGVYAFMQLPSRSGFEGEFEASWRARSHMSTAPGLVGFASGELSGPQVVDPAFSLVAPGPYLERSVQFFHWVESCAPAGPCSYEAKWVSKPVDSSKFNPAYSAGKSNPAPSAAPYQTTSVAFGGHATVGGKRISADLVRRLWSFAKPYKVTQDDVDVPGWKKEAGRYQTFEGEPKPGDVRVAFKYIPNRIDLTLAARADQKGQLSYRPGSNDIMAKPGAMSPEELLGLEWYRLPGAGFGFIAASILFFVLGVAALWTNRNIERQLMAERRKRGERRSGDRRTADRRSGQRRTASAKPKA